MDFSILWLFSENVTGKIKKHVTNANRRHEFLPF